MHGCKEQPRTFRHVAGALHVLRMLTSHDLIIIQLYTCRTRCDSLYSIAVYLRFQLPPLHLANEECVLNEMKSLMGADRTVTKAIVQALNVQSKRFSHPSYNTKSLQEH